MCAVKYRDLEEFTKVDLQKSFDRLAGEIGSERAQRHLDRTVKNLSIQKVSKNQRPGNGTERTRPGIKSLRETHMVIAQRAAMGDRNVDIASDLGMSKEHVSYIRNSPIIQAEIASNLARLEDVRFKVQEKIAEHAVDAVRVVAEVMNSKVNKSETRLRAALGILDRNGNGPSQTLDVRPRSTVLTGDDLLDIKNNGAAYLRRLKEQGVIVQVVEKDCVDVSGQQSASSAPTITKPLEKSQT